MQEHIGHAWHQGGAAVAFSTNQVCCCCSLQVWRVKHQGGPPSYDHRHHAADAEGDHHDEDPCHQRRTVVRLHQFRTPLNHHALHNEPSGPFGIQLRPVSCAGHAIKQPAQQLQGKHAELRNRHHSNAAGHLQQSTKMLRAVRCGTCPQEPLPCSGKPGHVWQGACTGSAAPAE